MHGHRLVRLLSSFYGFSPCLLPPMPLPVPWPRSGISSRRLRAHLVDPLLRLDIVLGNLRPGWPDRLPAFGAHSFDVMYGLRSDTLLFGYLLLILLETTPRLAHRAHSFGWYWGGLPRCLDSALNFVFVVKHLLVRRLQFYIILVGNVGYFVGHLQLGGVRCAYQRQRVRQRLAVVC